MSKQDIVHALRNSLDNGVLLGVAATLSVTIFLVEPFSSTGRYVTFWMVLPAVWMLAMSLTRVVREFLLTCYDGLGTTPRRVVAGGALGAALIMYIGVVTSHVPARDTARQTQPVTRLALVP